MKIWFRTPKANLTDTRTLHGMAISHDGVIAAFNRMGIECIDEYPLGNAYDAEQYIPPNKDDYLVIWYADPSMWEIERDERDTREPPVHRYRKGLVGYTRCGETKLSPHMVDVLNLCDVIFVGSANGAAFHQEYLFPPVLPLSGGFSPSSFYPIERDYHADPFVFLHAGATQWRKGSDIACKAFAKAFSNEQDVNLLLISPGETEMFMSLREEYKDDDRFRFESKVVFERDRMLSEYYAKGHCLVYPSILEAWGRCLGEGMASGMPCLVTRASGMLEQFSADCGWWIELSGEYIDGFALPSVDDLATKMRYAYEHRDECQEKGKSAGKFAQNYLTWEVGIGRALPALNAVYSTWYLNDVITELPEPIKLNVGCHLLRLDGWVNIDILARRLNVWGIGKNVPIAYLYDIRDPFAFDDDTVDAITVSHVLCEALLEEEHIPFLLECYRILKSGGILRITEHNSDHSYFPVTFPTTAEIMLDFLKQSGFSAKEVDGNETEYSDKSICLNAHGPPPKVYFVEGIK